VWEALWFAPGAPLGLIAARTVLGANALWIVLSRPDLPDLVSWPAAFWSGVPGALRLRYLMLPVGPLVEKAAYAGLCLALVAVVAGVLPRLSCFVAAALLYHFAPFEEILTTSNGPYLGGLTVPVLGLFILSFTPAPSRGDEPSPEYRWPLTLIRLLIACQYLFAGIAKLHFTGLHWISAENIEATALVFMTYEARPPWAHWLVGHPVLAGLTGAGVLSIELLFVLAVVSKAAARVLASAAAVSHLFLLQVFGIAPLSLPLLLLFLDWDALDRRHSTLAVTSVSMRPSSGQKDRSSARSSSAPNRARKRTRKLLTGVIPS
jgi:hypothetical protein